MRDYSRVHSAFWTSEDIRKMPEDARTLALYLLTSPHANMIGCFRMPDAYVCDDLQWSSGRVSKGFEELLANGFATHDKASKWVLIHKYLKLNPLENPNQGKAAARLFEQIPESSPVKSLCANAFGVFSSHIDPDVFEPFRNGSETLPESGTGTGTGTGTGHAPRGAGAALLSDEGIDSQVAFDFLAIRKAKRAPLTATALDGIKREAGKAGITLEDALRVCVERGWQAFKAEWHHGDGGKKNSHDLSGKDWREGLNPDGSF
jgi:hypothetical protein